MTVLTKKEKKNTPVVPKNVRTSMKEKDHQLVKGIFRCFEPRGGSIKFSFKKHAGDDVLTYTMKDGDTYDIPLMVAQHLNNNCWYPKHAHVLDANGHPSVEVGQKVQRCSFESLEFQTEMEEEVA